MASPGRHLAGDARAITIVVLGPSSVHATCHATNACTTSNAAAIGDKLSNQGPPRRHQRAVAHDWSDSFSNARRPPVDIDKRAASVVDIDKWRHRPSYSYTSLTAILFNASVLPFGGRSVGVLQSQGKRVTLGFSK